MPCPDGRVVNQLAMNRLRDGHAIRFVARGRSMWPTILDGDQVTIAPAYGSIESGHVVCIFQGADILVHRVIDVRGDGRIKTRGDALPRADGWSSTDHVLGRLVGVRRRGRRVSFSQTPLAARIATMFGHCRRVASRFRRR